MQAEKDNDTQVFVLFQFDKQCLSFFMSHTANKKAWDVKGYAS